MLERHENQTDEGAVAEDETLLEDPIETLMEVPVDLVPAVCQLIESTCALPNKPPGTPRVALHAFFCRQPSRIDGRDQRLVVALVLVGVGRGEVGDGAVEDVAACPGRSAMAMRSPERAWARASVQPHTRA